MLKSSNGTKIPVLTLIGIGLVVMGEPHNPCTVGTVLGRTPIVATSKTANHGFLQV